MDIEKVEEAQCSQSETMQSDSIRKVGTAEQLTERGDQLKKEERRVSKEEILECLSRSGYLLESRLVRALAAGRYFVQPNQAFRDPRTNKSREIDMVAEAYRVNLKRERISVQTHFVIEAINNRLPLVLVTPKPFSLWSPCPRSDAFTITPLPCPFSEHIDFMAPKHEAYDGNLFSQFCALTRKNQTGELMASHPDDIYGSLLKMAEYADCQVRESTTRLSGKDDYWRVFYWQPVLVLNDSLFITNTSDDGTISLLESNFGALEFNWHSDDEPRTTIIDVVTSAYLIEHLDGIVLGDDRVEEELHRCRQSLSATNGASSSG